MSIPTPATPQNQRNPYFLDSLLDANFLFFFVQSPSLVRRLTALVAGSLYPAVSDSEVFEQELCLPPLAEQRHIAARLTRQMVEVECARASAKAQLAAVNDVLTANLQEAFQGIIPLSAGRDNAAPPTSWQWRRLIDLARLETGHTPSRKHSEWWKGDVPWIALPDIRQIDCREAQTTAEYTNAEGLANSSARLLPLGTVCLSRTASVGFVTILGRAMATSQDFVNWVCGSDLDPWFLLWAIRASRAFIRSQSTGAIHKTVYLPVAESFEICAPPLDEQRRIAKQLRTQFVAVEAAQLAAEAQLAAVNQLPAAYLREAFSGPL